MDKIPNEIITSIFRDYLELIDVLKLRTVSKRFRFLIDSMNLKQIAIYTWGVSFRARFDCKTDIDHIIVLEKFIPTPNSSFQTVFINLKHLSLLTKLDESFNLELLNELSNLENLHIHHISLPPRDQILKLKNLKVFQIGCVYISRKLVKRKRESGWDEKKNWQSYIILDSKVEVLDSSIPEEIKLIHPSCIKHLKTSFCRFKKETLDSLTSLQNLTLKFYGLPSIEKLKNQLNEIDIRTLFEVVKKIDIIPRQNGQRDQIRMIVNELVNQKLLLKKDIKVCCFSIPVYRSFDETFKDSNLFAINNLIRHYEKLKDVHKRGVDYDALIYELGSQNETLLKKGIKINERLFPDCFFKKFTNITSAYVNQIDNESNFIWFLENCHKLTELEFEDGCLTQDILNQLPVLCKFLKELRIYVEDENGENNLDYEPISKFKQLSILSIIHFKELRYLELYHAIKFIEKCRYLNLMHLQDFSYEKNSEKLFDISRYIEKNNYWKKNNINYIELKQELDELLKSLKN